MTIPALSSVGPVQASAADAIAPSGLSASSGTASGPGAATFGNLVSQGMEAVNQQLIGSEVDLQHLATGDTQNLHQVMIRLEETRLSFQLFMQVRNRVLEAYQDIMKMQV